MIGRDSVGRGAVAVMVVVAGAATWALSGRVGTAAQEVGGLPRAAAGRFEFLVVESFDARYFQDTPGHRGVAASGRLAPRVALFDPVMRGATQVGQVTHLDWNEARESLEVEFNPKPEARICIGDAVWIPIPPEPPR